MIAAPCCAILDGMSPPESPRDEERQDLTWTGGDADEPQAVEPEPRPESEAEPAPRSRSIPPPGMEDWSAKPAASEASRGGLLAAIKRKLGR